MKVCTKSSDICPHMVGIAASKDANSHRWIVHVLAEMIEYSEAHKLDEVASSLIAAIEQVSPSLVTTKVAGATISPDDGVRGKEQLENVIDFKNFRKTCTYV